MRLSLILWMLLGSITAISQTLKGKIISDYSDLEGITILNLSQKKTYSSQKQGYFIVIAQVGDTLNFSSVQFKSKQVVVKKQNFGNDLFFVPLEISTIYLQEVLVTKEKNGFEMGVLSKKAKEFTPAERRLHTAGDFKYADLLGLFGGSLPLDPILNKINGRTARLKKEVDIEKKEFELQKINDWFDDRYYTQTLKIPSDLINGFKYFILEDQNFEKTLQSKNKTMAKFLMVDLAQSFLQLQKQ